MKIQHKGGVILLLYAFISKNSVFSNDASRSDVDGGLFKVNLFHSIPKLTLYVEAYILYY
ncbi:hypothetical protein [Ureibacillus thermosphaericus]|jgi:hypothetical protein|uniref:hypothetical protein n=1 Tax=Ureibacillus sp. FSL K6-0786 TaxID=2954607 RepID=UPI000303D9A4